MDYQLLRNELKEIVEISLTVPEQFQQKCFETLLNAFLAKQQSNIAKDDSKEPATSSPQHQPNDVHTIPLTAQLRLFIQRTGLSTESINSIILYSNGEVYFVREPANKTIRKGQISWALLLALKNVILKDSFDIDPEDVRSICKEKGFYDAPNFAKNFRAKPYVDYFKGILEPQGNPQPLTSEGQTALAGLIKELAG